MDNDRQPVILLLVAPVLVALMLLLSSVRSELKIHNLAGAEFLVS